MKRTTTHPEKARRREGALARLEPHLSQAWRTPDDIKRIGREIETLRKRLGRVTDGA